MGVSCGRLWGPGLEVVYLASTHIPLARTQWHGNSKLTPRHSSEPGRSLGSWHTPEVWKLFVTQHYYSNR